MLTVLLVVDVVLVCLVFVLLIRSFHFKDPGTEVRADLQGLREELILQGKSQRDELSASLKNSLENMFRTQDALARNQQGLAQQQQSQMNQVLQNVGGLMDSMQKHLQSIRDRFDERMRELQEGNEKKLEEMRRVVDEKLQESLEKRLSESFSVVSQRLEAVHRGLGEMQSLAAGVGELKRVLTNVKTRGTWGEVQLESILEQLLAKEQYEKNVAVRPDSGERVEFAIRLPRAAHSQEPPVWLPIDAKFPQEDYIRLQNAAEAQDAQAVKNAVEALSRAVRKAADDIAKKYIHPPHTTDFAILFLATEGLYAEVLRQTTLVEELHRKHIILAGPTTLSAILNSLRLGLQTLAIEQRASEVQKLLGAVRAEFEKFQKVTEKVQKHLQTAANAMEETQRRTRAMERVLKNVELLPENQVDALLSLKAGPQADNDPSL